ncbi:hypothetical protein KJ815_13185 [bacterium]|nr:hypothetical protein [bacterium]
MHGDATRSTEDKVRLFRRVFSGLTHVYGTYDPATGRARQVKRAVTDRVILTHLHGRQSYGVYLLVGDRTRAVVADFDVEDTEPPMDFVAAARGYGLPAYIERSKSKGHHVWMFLDEAGVSAAKARLVVRHILEEIEHPNTEVFPKHDRLDPQTAFGNYIYAPLFGALVPKGRTVFLDPAHGLRPYDDQWQLLENAGCVTEGQLEEIIQINELNQHERGPAAKPQRRMSAACSSYGLPPCARTMLAEGVTANQRVACFRLAVNLKRAGLPVDSTVAVLKDWATRNRPENGKRTITEDEIVSQTGSAYDKEYRACGCEEPAVARYCQPGCPVNEGPGSGRSGERRAGAPRQEASTNQIYCACKVCTAKWFCDTETTTCPRCGSDQVSRTLAKVPWLNGSSAQAHGRGEFAGNRGGGVFRAPVP